MFSEGSCSHFQNRTFLSLNHTGCVYPNPLVSCRDPAVILHENAQPGLTINCQRAGQALSCQFIHNVSLLAFAWNADNRKGCAHQHKTGGRQVGLYTVHTYEKL